MNELSQQITTLLTDKDSSREIILDKILSAVLHRFRSETGTIHVLDAGKQWLHLAAQTGLPPQILEVVKTIPVGKGIAGQVASENRPVTICNLQIDTSGVAQPAAKQTGMGGALCVPIRHEGKIAGTFGIGTVREYDYSAAEINTLQEIADLVGANETFKH